MILIVPGQINFQMIQNPGKLQEKGAGAQNMPYLKPTLFPNKANKFLVLIRTVGIGLSLASN